MKRKILEAAKALFLDQGFEKTSIRNIADAIEYSPSTIYLYFKDNYCNILPTVSIPVIYFFYIRAEYIFTYPRIHSHKAKSYLNSTCNSN